MEKRRKNRDIRESTHRGSEVEESKSRNIRQQQNKKPMERTVFMAGAKTSSIYASLSHKSQNILQI